MEIDTTNSIPYAAITVMHLSHHPNSKKVPFNLKIAIFT